MRKTESSCWLFFALLVLSGSGPEAKAQTAGVLREVYPGIGGAAIADLISSPSYPGSPAAENIITDFFEAPIDVDENYGQRLRALIQAPSTGNYAFWIASDDAGQLFLSTDDKPENKRSIATVPGWTSSREWTKYPEQKSAAITLAAGQKYYIEALMKEAGGGDNLSVRWQLPNGAIEEPIPASRLTVYGLTAPQITQQPSSISVIEGNSATFIVQLAHMTGASFQWQRNGVNIPNATGPNYTIAVTTLNDSGTTFRCVINNGQGSATSSPATLTIVRDTTPPTIASVVNLGANITLSVLFSEPVETASANLRSNYAINGGATILTATLENDARTVVLATSPLSPSISYTLTVNGVRDRASIPNTIAANSQRSFSLDFTPLEISDVLGKTEALGPSSRRTGLVISEIMYHPAERTDGHNLEFVELYNSNPFFEDISGYRLTGAVDYTFPPNTKLAARSFLVIAKAPGDVRTLYGISDVFGPFTNSLQNGSVIVRLRNNLGAVLLEAAYSSEFPYPPAADGAGHSLVLARPSYGERNHKAWSASALVGGSPGGVEPNSNNPYRTVVINEFLAHTDDPDLDYIELFNYSAQSVNLSGCFLSDDPGTNKFTIAAGTTIPPKGFVVFNQNQLGFALSAAGETIYLRSPNNDRVIDAVRFKGQANGVATGRYPDGAASFRELLSKTPGAPNAPLLMRDVVINEIMYNPVSGNADDQYVELYNRGSSAIDLSGWRLGEAVKFKFPANTVLAPNSYLVVARDAQHLRTNYASLGLANTFGNFEGKLSGQGERIVLEMPDEVASTNSSHLVVTNTIHIVVDEVSYGTGGRWGQWSDGRGSSLELIDSETDHRLASNWADSDESGKSAWTTVQWTGVLDNGNGAADSLQIFLQGPGECLVDNVEVFASGGQNLVANSTFESGADGWFFQGTHDESSLESNEGFNSAKSLHVRAAGRGDTGANRIRTALTTVLNAGQTATIRAKVRWLKGNPEILLRLHGNWLEAAGNIVAAQNLGSPGARNSRAVANAGPAIDDVKHSPLLPSPNQPVTVTAKVHDVDGLASLLLSYRVDPSTNVVAISMVNNGAGIFSATIPAQSAGAMVAFSIKATDGNTPSAASTFPIDAPARECLIRFGESQPGGTFGTYHLWFTQATQARWSAREKNSNKPLDATFVYNNERVVYNMGTLYSGSPWHTPGYNSPVGNNCDYVAILPADDSMFGASDFVLATVGNLDNDDSAQREQAAFWMLGQLGVQNNYRRYINLFVNGNRRARIYEDSQQPNADVVAEWFPDDNDGDLHKVEDWFEFDNTGDNKQFNVDATLQKFTTTAGVKKLARYRWNWRKRAVSDSANAYSNLFQLVDALNNSNATAYTQQTEVQMDVDEWARVFCVEHIAGNWDAYGSGRGKNMYAYKPKDGKWQLFAWDIDFVLGSGGDDAQTDMFAGINDPTIVRFLNHPPFRRAYFRAMEDAVNGPLALANISPLLDAKYAAFQANGIGAADPGAIKSFITARRQYILTSHLAQVAADFAITSNGGSNFSTNKNSISLTGTAPVGVKTLEINGVSYPLTWNTVTNWSLNFALAPGLNTLAVRGYDIRGNAIASAQKNISITFTGAAEQPQDFLVINEIMYNATVPDASFVEIYNRSAATAFDLSNWRLDGAGFTFAEGTIIQPGAYLVIANDATAFAATYGSSIPVAGVYSGRLQNNGETLKLVKIGASPEQDQIIDEVTYESALPWPSLASGFGPSLQLIDPSQDNNRAMNWAAVQQTGGGGGTSTQGLVTMTQNWRYEQSDTDLAAVWRERSYNDASWASGPALLYVETADLPAPKNTALTLGKNTYYFRTHFNFAGNPANTTLSLSAIVDDGAVVYLNSTEVLRIGMPEGAVNYATFAARTVGDAALEGPYTIPATALVAGDNVLAVEVHQVNATSSDIVFGLTLDSLITSSSGGAPYTPGAANSVRASLPSFPQLWLNEVAPNNASGLQDRMGDGDPWVELYNSGSTAINLSGYFLSDNYANLMRWPFPANFTINPGQRIVVWLDGEPGESTAAELHTNFRIPAVDGSVVLVNTANSQAMVVDYLNYKLMTADHSYGAYLDGTGGKRQKFFTPTPAAPNNNAYPPQPIYINEWMAGNTHTIADSADGDFEDWFELYNGGPVAVDLSGFTLTDTLVDPKQWTVPDGTIIASDSYLLVWADGETGQNGSNTDLHANFKLSQSGETLGLFTPTGVLVDSIEFGAQTNDVSQGRWPDGNGAPFQFMETPTPRTANVFGNNANVAPVLAPIGNKSVSESTTLTFTASAMDPNSGQSLTFSLDPGAPAGAGVNPISGVFTWTLSEAQGPGTLSTTIRVTDNGSPPLSDFEAITITVQEVNSAPTIALIPDQAVAPGNAIAFTVEASDADLPAQALTFSLDANAPAGANINSSTGSFTWTPTSAQSGQTYPITLLVTDSGAPALNAARTFNIAVASGNTPPILAPIGNKSVTKGSTVTFTAAASDPDLPAQTLTFSLDTHAPEGATINSTTGAFTWTPASPQGPGLFPLIVTVSDNGVPALSASETILVNVVAVNTPPILASINNQTVAEGTVLSFPVLAGDREGQRISYSLAEGAPEGAKIDSETQTFSWTPTEVQGPGSYIISIRATDDGTPPMSDAKTFTVTVIEVNAAPVLAPMADQTVSVGDTLSFTPVATDPDLPAQKLNFALAAGASTGATLDPSTGFFTWTPVAGQAPSTNQFTIRATDSFTPALTDEKSFQVIVKAPSLIHIESVALSAPEELLISWATENQRVYRVQIRDDLEQGTWQNLGEPITAMGSLASKSDHVQSVSRRFYRIVLDR